MPSNDLQSTNALSPMTNLISFPTNLSYSGTFSSLSFKHPTHAPSMSPLLWVFAFFQNPSPNIQMTAWLSVFGSFGSLLKCHFLSEAFSDHLKGNSQPSFSLSLPSFFSIILTTI